MIISLQTAVSFIIKHNAGTVSVYAYPYKQLCGSVKSTVQELCLCAHILTNSFVAQLKAQCRSCVCVLISLQTALWLSWKHSTGALTICSYPYKQLCGSAKAQCRGCVCVIIPLQTVLSFIIKHGAGTVSGWSYPYKQLCGSAKSTVQELCVRHCKRDVSVWWHSHKKSSV